MNLAPEIRQMSCRATPVGWLDPRLEISLAGGRIRDLRAGRVPHAHQAGTVPGETAAASGCHVVNPHVALPRDQHPTTVGRYARVLVCPWGNRADRSNGIAITIHPHERA